MLQFMKSREIVDRFKKNYNRYDDKHSSIISEILKDMKYSNILNYMYIKRIY